MTGAVPGQGDPGAGMGLGGKPIPQAKIQHVWEEVYAPGISPPGANPFLAREHRCLSLASGSSTQRLFPCNTLFCSRVACLQSHITFTKSIEDIYLLYFAFGQLCPGTMAPILIDYTAIFLNFSSKDDVASHLNRLSRNPLQRPYHSNFSHILCLCMHVWYFALISSPSPLQ